MAKQFQGARWKLTHISFLLAKVILSLFTKLVHFLLDIRFYIIWKWKYIIRFIHSVSWNLTTAGFGCPSETFTCSNKKCIPEALKCDGKNDCGDNTDEEEGCCDFTCKNHKCIHHDAICNGIDDCGDFSDEEDCKGNIQCHIWLNKISFWNKNIK